jgi:hypothetical protein
LTFCEKQRNVGECCEIFLFRPNFQFSIVVNSSSGRFGANVTMEM